MTLPVRSACLLAATLVLAVLALAPSSASAARGMETALQDDLAFVHQHFADKRFTRERALQRARELRVSWIRINMEWERVELHPRRYDFSYYDEAIEAIRRAGMHVQVTLAGDAPAFATGNGIAGKYKPSVSRFAAFAAAAATHYRGRVRRYSLWNEPNWFTWLQPPAQAPRMYRELFRAGYSAIKGVAPESQVLFGETSPLLVPGRSKAPLDFLRKVFCVDRNYKPVRRCPRIVADGYAQHPYDFTRAPEVPNPNPDNVTMAQLSKLTGALDKLARRGLLRTPAGRPLDLWLTEFGYFQKGPRRISQARRAAYTKRAWAIARRNRRVRQMLQYMLISPPKTWEFFDTAILDRSGNPLPVFRALRSAAR